MDPFTMAAIGAGIGGVKAAGGMGMFSTTDPGKAGRDANQARVKAGKAQNDALRKQAHWAEKTAIESLKILKRNNQAQLDRMDEIATRDWWQSELYRFDKFRGEIEAFNQSVEDYATALNFNEISFNLSKAEEENHMKDFYTNMRFEVADAKLTLAQQLTSSATDRNQLRAQQEGVRMAHRHEQDATSLQGLMEQGKVLASGAVGRSSRKATQAILAGVSAQQAMRTDALYNRESQFRGQMQKSWNEQYFNKLGYKQGIKQINASIDSQRRAHEIRMDKMQATKYAADLSAKAKIHPVPKLGRMTPIPFMQLRPEYQKIKEGSWRNFMPKDPYLEDENKIYGDKGPSTMDKVLGVGMGMAQGAVSAWKPSGGTNTNTNTGTGNAPGQWTGGVEGVIGQRNPSGGITGWGGGSTGVGP